MSPLTQEYGFILYILSRHYPPFDIADIFHFVAVENQKMMLGTFSPQLEPYVYEGEEETTPTGMFARGSYSAKLKVTTFTMFYR